MESVNYRSTVSHVLITRNKLTVHSTQHQPDLLVLMLNRVRTALTLSHKITMPLLAAFAALALSSTAFAGGSEQCGSGNGPSGSGQMQIHPGVGGDQSHNGNGNSFK